MAGTLYVVATPLGNLADLSPRAADVLRSADVVAAEDTRRTRPLLAHLGAHPALLSYHAHSPEGQAAKLVARLCAGETVALVSDAGTPAISDPGAELVAAARAAGVPVVPIPGPSAVATVLSACGFGADRYLFLGFAPRKGAERDALLGRAAREPWPVVFFEAPNRLAALLDDLARVAGADRPAAVGRELTKLHEEIRVGTLAELAAYYGNHEPRGECTVVLHGRPEDAAEAAPDAGAVEAFARARLAEGHSRSGVVRDVVARFGLPRNEAYRLVTELA